MQNIIVNNTALTGKGGGINLSLPSSSAAVLVTNNTIANNTAYANTAGIYTTVFAQPATLTNNIIVAPSGQNPVTCDGTYSTVSPTFSHNDAYGVGSSSPGFLGFCVAGSSRNFSADPLFLNASNNDFHVSSASPVVDAGDNSASNEMMANTRQIRSSMAVAALLLSLSCLSTEGLAAQLPRLKPKAGYVPDANTAISIGDAVMVSMFGEE